MSMIWDPTHMLILASIAMVIAFYVAGEMFERKPERKPVPVRTDEAERRAIPLDPSDASR